MGDEELLTYPASTPVEATGGSTTATLPNRFGRILNVVDDFGADPTGVADSLPAFNAAIAAFSYSNASQTVQTGGLIFIPTGTYYVSGSINTHAKHGLGFKGAGPNRTIINAGSGNYPIFEDIGTATDGTAKLRISDLTLVGGGSGNANAHGIQWDFVVHSNIENVNGGGCNHLFDINDAWQVNLIDVFSDSQFAPKNNISLHCGPQGASAMQNTINIVNASFYNDQQYGIWAEWFTGGVWQSVQTGAAGTACILLGNPSSGSPACTFLNADILMVDSVAGDGLQIVKGSASEIGDITIKNFWGGNTGSSGGSAVKLSNAEHVIINGGEIATCDIGINLIGCTNCDIDLTIRDYNRNSSGNGAVVVNGGSNNSIRANVSTSNPAVGYNGYVETGGTNGNQLWGFGEALWTPALAFSVTNPSGLTYSLQGGTFSVEGRRVHLNGFISLSSAGSGGSGQIEITGLPYESDAGSYNFGALINAGLNNVNSFPAAHLFGQVGINSTSIALNLQGPSGQNTGVAAPAYSNLTNSTVVFFGGEYLRA